DVIGDTPSSGMNRHVLWVEEFAGPAGDPGELQRFTKHETAAPRCRADQIGCVSHGRAPGVQANPRQALPYLRSLSKIHPRSFSAVPKLSPSLHNHTEHIGW